MTAHLEASGRTVAVGNPDKVVFPDDGITKRDLAGYYLRVAENMLPHIAGRPLVMHRFPDGIGGEAFYQKDAPGHFPDWVHTRRVPKEGGEVTHVVCDDAATLVYLADQACITLHVWLSSGPDLDRPDRLVFDLDPPSHHGDPAPVRFAARAVRRLIGELGLACRLMTTGSAGFHVVVPLDGEAPFAATREFARQCAGVVAGRHPDRLTVEQRISRRRGRVFVDYLRNSYAQTTVAPYSVRARAGAPVATPIDWKELSGVNPTTYTVGNLFRRLGQKADPWTGDGIPGQPLGEARDRLAELGE